MQGREVPYQTFCGKNAIHLVKKTVATNKVSQTVDSSGAGGAGHLTLLKRNMEHSFSIGL